MSSMLTLKRRGGGSSCPRALEQSAQPAAPADFLLSDLPACSNSIQSITMELTSADVLIS